MAATVPAGYVLVPIEPTRAILDAAMATAEKHLLGDWSNTECVGDQERADKSNRDYWQAMLAAAPQPPVAGQPAEPSPAAPPFIHKKSGGRYQFVGLAHLQTDQPLGDMASVTVYRGEDGRLWAREGREFVERFEQEGRPFYLRDDLLEAEQEALAGTGGVLAISPELLAQMGRAAPKGDSNG